MNSKRIDYLDMVKGFGILLVVIGHMQDISTGLRIWISSFHMPLFFVVTGILIYVKSEPEKDFRVTVTKKFKGIIVPYLWFSLSYFIIDILNLLVIKNIDTRTFIVDTISSITFYGMSVLWFLPALFLSIIIFIFIKRLTGNITIIIIFAASILAYYIRNVLSSVYDTYSYSLLITSLINIVYIILRAIICSGFICLGYYFGHILLEAKILSNKIFCAVSGIIALVLNVIVAMQNDCADLHNILLNNIFLYYIGAILGCYSVIILCKVLPVIGVVRYYGKNSLIVMACHINYYILYAGIRFAWVIDPYVTRAKHYVFVTIVVVTVFVLSTIVIEAINRFFPFVLGKPFSIPFIGKNKER